MNSLYCKVLICLFLVISLTSATSIHYIDKAYQRTTAVPEGVISKLMNTVDGLLKDKQISDTKVAHLESLVFKQIKNQRTELTSLRQEIVGLRQLLNESEEKEILLRELTKNMSIEMEYIREELFELKRVYNKSVEDILLCHQTAKGNDDHKQESIENSLTNQQNFSTMPQKPLFVKQLKQNTSADIHEQLQEVSLSIAHLNNTVMRITGNVLGKVGFTAVMTSIDNSWTHNEKLIFPKVLFNNGGGYSSMSGIFTAPYDGIYVFYCAIQSNYDQSFRVNIIINGESKVHAMAYVNHSDTYEAASNMIVSSLKRGDKVWVQNVYGGHMYSESYPATTFSGFLI